MTPLESSFFMVWCQLSLQPGRLSLRMRTTAQPLSQDSAVWLQVASKADICNKITSQ